MHPVRKREEEMTIRRFVIAVAIFLAATLAGAGETLLLREPTIGGGNVVFSHGGDLWVVGLEGGAARRLTTSIGRERSPHLSPDGTLVAFSGEYEGNVDVYVVPVTGGEPRRLTWHPGPDGVRGWTPDGTHVIFASGRDSAPIPVARLWTVSLDGGLPEPLPLPRAYDGDLAPDGRRLAYEMIQRWDREWRGYRGGQANPIRIVDLETLDVQKLPWEGSVDTQPVWLAESVCFLSDRDGVTNVWRYDPATGALEQLTHFDTFDAKWLASDGERLVVEDGARLWIVEPGSDPRPLQVEVRGDFPWARPHWEEVAEELDNPAISPHGKRVAFEARGEILTVPVKKGDARNISRSTGAADRTPFWSPDGTRVAWFSDASGEYRLIIAGQHGEKRREIELPQPTFFYTPAWSPDGKHIAYGDADRNLWVLDVATGKARIVGNGRFAHPERIIAPAWSPDSRFLAFASRLTNQYGAVFIHSMEEGWTRRLTDGLADCRDPVWDAGGKYLWFLASTDYGLNVGWLDMTSYDRPVDRALYLVVLRADEPSPLLPESDEEEAEAEAAAGKPEKKRQGDDTASSKKKTPEVRIDWEGIAQRIVAVDLPERDYQELAAGSEGTIFLVDRPREGKGLRVHRYTLEDRKAEKILGGVTAFDVSADGKKILYGKPDGKWAVADAAGTPKPGKGALKTDGLRIKVDPPAEWRQIFREAWRYQRDYFYVENVHGLDLQWAYDTYGPWVEHVRHRDDLNYVLDILGGETCVGHSFVRGGDIPEVKGAPAGLLGADLEEDSGRYRIARIYTGESWNPDLDAPLAAPGVDVKEGDYLISVNGTAVTADTNPYAPFEGTAGRQTVIEVASSPDGAGARTVTVVPVKSETALRRAAWIEGNRRLVDSLSGGKLAYVWLPNTGRAGYEEFNRYYFSQQDKQGAVIDERFNGGGSAADYMVDLLARPLMGFFSNPVGKKQPFTLPNAGIWGPKVLVINETAGSGGDLLPYMFRLRKIGPLVGTRTWGGLVGIWDVPPLMDGGFITAPRGGFYDLEGRWSVENEGVAPDIEVEQDPKLVAQGHDPQLERAVAVALELLEAHPVTIGHPPEDQHTPARLGRRFFFETPPESAIQTAGRSRIIRLSSSTQDRRRLRACHIG